MENLNEQIRLHSLGATVRHKSTFENLISFKNEEELTPEFIKEWAVPFYMNLEETNQEWFELLLDAKKKITKEDVIKLLGDLNWRTRQTGAFFAIINNYSDLIDIIGIHFLKSEVCYAGRIYAYMFASLNNKKATEYLDDYLAYYLSKSELWFDQSEAMEALAYLDKINNSKLIDKHKTNWLNFIQNKPNWKAEINTEYLENYIRFINKVKDNK
ncbi:hypothetical protein SAMN05444397_109199 [Flavobacterium aquidurense]|uniref:Uncharacterized protein n=1 Tax=Flavobacterium frigidimaris TaxID=262320 RepID=A0ABX4BUY8_FLAFR|nr:DUF6000 family protein [Flavobacterium frigidimaris]OXA81091.1 hypothetical protein B0A65_04930 [Flavobacterium frigidimaris]SDZ58586.1 hypothetical protein SAMN05444397_109199 [Flavobacterium aquidurense]